MELLIFLMRLEIEKSINGAIPVTVRSYCNSTLIPLLLILKKFGAILVTMRSY